MDTADIEALEAGDGFERRKSWSNLASTGAEVLGSKQQERKASWVDLGIGKVEDVVGGWVAGVARWAEDDDGQGVLLPVVDRRREVKVN